MSKYYGSIGYVSTIETSPGVYEEIVTTRNYSGEVYRLSSSVSGSDSVNDSFNLNNQLSILADPYAYQNFHAIRFVNWLGSNWKVTSVEVQFPRLVLSLGGLYNGDTNGSA